MSGSIACSRLGVSEPSPPKATVSSGSLPNILSRNSLLPAGRLLGHASVNHSSIMMGNEHLHATDLPFARVRLYDALDLAILFDNCLVRLLDIRLSPCSTFCSEPASSPACVIVSVISVDRSFLVLTAWSPSTDSPIGMKRLSSSSWELCSTSTSEPASRSLSVCWHVSMLSPWSMCHHTHSNASLESVIRRNRSLSELTSLRAGGRARSLVVASPLGPVLADSRLLVDGILLRARGCGWLDFSHCDVASCIEGRVLSSVGVRSRIVVAARGRW